MALFIFIALATACYTLFEIFTSRMGNKIDANLGAIIFNGLGALAPFVVYIVLKFVNGAKLIASTTSGVMYSILAGISIALFSIFLIKSFERGGLAYVVPLIYGGSIVLASLTGWMIFKESISFLHGIGIVVIVIGLVCVVIAKLHTSAV